MLLRSEPFRELNQLVGQLAGPMAAAALRAPTAAPLAADVYRRDDQLTILIDLPGVDLADLDVSVDGRQLTVSAERRYSPDPTDSVMRAERSWGEFSRTFTIPSTYDLEHLTAELDAGVLTLRLPVIPERSPRKIEVEVTSRSRAEEHQREEANTASS